MAVPSSINYGPAARGWPKTTWAALFTLLTPLTMLVHGYHPFAEDGGIYTAGIFLRLDPSLFPHTAEFVRAPMRYSGFASAVAALVRFTHVPPAWLLLVASLFSTWLTIFAARQVLRRCTTSSAAQLGGVALLAVWWTLPVAGTSLMLMDPYVTARSFSTPLSLLAIAFALSDEGPTYPPLALSLACLLLAAAMHPLMAGYAVVFVIIVRICMAERPAPALVALTLAAVVFGGVLQFAAPRESAAWLAAEITRYYWFLSQWQWYELMGLVGPLLILGWLALRAPAGWSQAARALCRACVIAGLIGMIVALLYARENAPVHLVARLQPLRLFVFSYAVMPLMLGALAVHAGARLADAARSPALRSVVRAAPFVVVTVLAGVMSFVQRETFPGSLHLELPWRSDNNPNPWIAAFLWARSNTPRDAFFALPANYITTAGEDAQTFRAIALRDALPDYSKDGGEAAIAGFLAPAWQQGAAAQKDLDRLSDAERFHRLYSPGVTWLVLHSDAATAFPCPYDNGTIKVCRMQEKS